MERGVGEEAKLRVSIAWVNGVPEEAEMPMARFSAAVQPFTSRAWTAASSMQHVPSLRIQR